MTAEDMAEVAIRALDRSEPETAHRIFNECVESHGQQWTCEVFIVRLTLEAARAMDTRSYVRHQKLFEFLCNCNSPYMDRRYIQRRFEKEGAALELVPPGERTGKVRQLVVVGA